MRIDLQLHSTYSDGYLTPTKLAKFMSKNEVKVASLTDHNTVGGLEEFKIACRKYGIKAIPGMELYVKLNHQKFNILWYNFDDTSPKLHKMLRDSQTRRRRQVRKILKHLVDKGFKMEVEKTLDKYNHYVPLNKMVDELWSHSSNMKRIKKELGTELPTEGEIIREYFHNANIGVLMNSYINIHRVLKLRKKIGGQIVLCHPGKHNKAKREFLSKVKEIGIDGVELLSPHHTLGTVMHIQRMAREFDFIETGGSDFHRFEGNNMPLQYSWEYYHIRESHLRGIKKIIG
jgi:hypothetical protein